MGVPVQLNDLPKSTLNLSELLTRVGNDRELLSELLGIFKQECGPLLHTLQAAVSSEDMKLIETTSHTLKGMLASLAASRASSAASHLEQIGHGQERTRLNEAWNTLESEIALLMP